MVIIMEKLRKNVEIMDADWEALDKSWADNYEEDYGDLFYDTSCKCAGTASPATLIKVRIDSNLEI